MAKPDARTLLFERIRTRPAKFVHVCGVPYTVARETAENPEDSDHIHLTLEVPPFGWTKKNPVSTTLAPGSGA